MNNEQRSALVREATEKVMREFDAELESGAGREVERIIAALLAQVSPEVTSDAEQCDPADGDAFTRAFDRGFALGRKDSQPSAFTDEDRRRLPALLASAIAEVDAAFAPDATMQPITADGDDLVTAQQWARGLLARLR